MGVFPKTATPWCARPGLPHACGGVSPARMAALVAWSSSPRLWGCFWAMLAHFRRLYVFPTPVGVFLCVGWFNVQVQSLPHACGGVSPTAPVCPRHFESSPRLWGCFPPCGSGRPQCRVFPTPVGVFPHTPSWYAPTVCLPHACGGVSSAEPHKITDIRSSPRLWGCFQPQEGRRQRYEVFPTPVGVFLILVRAEPREKGLPHACGGVSSAEPHKITDIRSSPRLWGCFYRMMGCQMWGGVFPTPVGVFPPRTTNSTFGRSLPHACGGVSMFEMTVHHRVMSSPRLWGCFF